MRAYAGLLVLACGLAACGGGSSKESSNPTPSAGEQTYLTKMASLCEAATQATQHGPLSEALDHYSAFVRSVKQLHAPSRYGADHKRRIAIEERMLGPVETLQPTIAGAGKAERASAYDLLRQAYGRDDALDARAGLVGCIWVPRTTVAEEAYPPATAVKLRELAPRLDGICADNASRTVYARTLVAKEGGDRKAARHRIADGSAERLARLVTRMPTPPDGGGQYAGWRDAVKTVANLLRLASQTSNGERAAAHRAQAERVAGASRKTAKALGLADCAKGDAAAAAAAKTG